MVDSKAQVMADALTNFGLLYAAKDDAKIEVQLQLSLQISRLNAFAQERAVQTHVEAEEPRERARIEAEERKE